MNLPGMSRKHDSAVSSGGSSLTLLSLVMGLALAALIAFFVVRERLTDSPETIGEEGNGGDVATDDSPFGGGSYQPRRPPIALDRQPVPEAGAAPVDDQAPIPLAKSGDPDFEAIVGEWTLAFDDTARLMNKDTLEEASADPDAIQELLAATLQVIERGVVKVEFRRDGTFHSLCDSFPAWGVVERTAGTFTVAGNIVRTRIETRDGLRLEPVEDGHFSRAGDRLILPEAGEPSAILHRKP